MRVFPSPDSSTKTLLRPLCPCPPTARHRMTCCRLRRASGTRRARDSCAPPSASRFPSRSTSRLVPSSALPSRRPCSMPSTFGRPAGWEPSLRLRPRQLQLPTQRPAAPRLPCRRTAARMASSSARLDPPRRLRPRRAPPRPKRPAALRTTTPMPSVRAVLDRAASCVSWTLPRWMRRSDVLSRQWSTRITGGRCSATVSPCASGQSHHFPIVSSGELLGGGPHPRFGRSSSSACMVSQGVLWIIVMVSSWHVSRSS